ncbi:reactive mitochondrial oxygen species modulator 1-domain-containing protein [Armillaria luteobubalina]|uniref:Reactive mitochondrial oxygen species modulator 1-domain-containing protein n=1 Tax=Armillaria luteobubalina TaxID=153913 RepID=A0AA39URT2_9AGAR|nr:reactive mitochondrial oxygen species modulator 1-domain-containing protein [Armillaria luteobubalina]
MSQFQRRSEPSVWDKSQMGAVMGAGVGLTIGFIFGSWSIFRYGAGTRGTLSTLSMYMLNSAATFSFFLSIGSVIRNDSTIPPHLEAQFTAPAMILRSRNEGLQIMKARWEEERRRQTNA